MKGKEIKFEVWCFIKVSGFIMIYWNIYMYMYYKVICGFINYEKIYKLNYINFLVFLLIIFFLVFILKSNVFVLVFNESLYFYCFFVNG